MNDAEKLIAATTRNHREDTPGQCRCGWRADLSVGYPDHLAVQIVKALGVLVRQEQWVPVEESGHRWSPRSEPDARYALEHFSATGDCHHPEYSPVVRIDHEARWVSEWKPVQP